MLQHRQSSHRPQTRAKARAIVRRSVYSRLQAEMLESRRLMAIDLASPVLGLSTPAAIVAGEGEGEGDFQGTAGRDAFFVMYGGENVVVTRSSNGQAPVTLGSVAPATPINLNGLGGDDSLTVVGSNASDVFVIGNGSMTVNASTIHWVSVESLLVHGNAGDDAYRLNADLALGVVRLLEEADEGSDTIDFSTTVTAAANMSLNANGEQTVSPNLKLHLIRPTYFENLVGTPNNDTLTGNSRANQLSGLAGNDQLDGLAGHDRLEGGAGDDQLLGKAGNDTYFFDADSNQGSDVITDVSGRDSIDLSSTTTLGATLSLAVTTKQTVNSNWEVTLVGNDSMEAIIGTQLADTLTGNALNNTLQGAGGNDTLQGGDGNDTYLFNADLQLGTDTITDTIGIDTLDFSPTMTSGVSVTLGTATSQVVNANLSLVLASAALMDHLIGSMATDTLTGNGLANSLTGNQGNDTLQGGLGDDTYWFAANSPLGTDTLNDVGGRDRLDFSQTVLAGVQVNLGIATLQTINSNLKLNLGSVDAFENVVGSAKNDTLIGNGVANRLTGGAGNDILRGNDGDDTLQGNQGDDDLRGGQDDDRYVFDADLALGSDQLEDSGGVDELHFGSTTTRSIHVQLGRTTTQVINVGLSLTLASATAFENVVGGARADVLVGNAVANHFTGGGGDDQLRGGGGDDTYHFDTDLALGTDTLDEAGGGFDTLDFSKSSTGGINVDLSQATSQVIRTGKLSLILKSGATFEKVIGTKLNDSITGNSLSNTLLGLAGNDTLTGLGGRDLLIGGLGADTLSGGDSEDLMIAGSTSHDRSSMALDLILDEWRSNHPRATRLANLGGGLGGLPALNRSTVRKDTLASQLNGGEGLDWFFANLSGTGTLDTIATLDPNENTVEL